MTPCWYKQRNCILARMMWMLLRACQITFLSLTAECWWIYRDAWALDPYRTWGCREILVSIHDTVQPHTTSSSLLAMESAHNLWLYNYCQQPANNQPYKDGEMSSLESRPESIIAFQDLRFYQCCHLVRWWRWTLVEIPERAFLSVGLIVIMVVGLWLHTTSQVHIYIYHSQKKVGRHFVVSAIIWNFFRVKNTCICVKIFASKIFEFKIFCALQ